MRHTVRLRQESGFTLIDMLFVMGIMGVLCSIALPRMLLARQSAGAASAIGSMRTIGSAELTFALTCGGGFYAPSLTTLGNPPPGSSVGFLGPSLAAGDSVIRAGYKFTLEAEAFDQAPGSCNNLDPGETGQGYIATADPTSPENPRHFAINASSGIFEHTAPLGGVMPEVGEPGSGHALR